MKHDLAKHECKTQKKSCWRSVSSPSSSGLRGTLPYERYIQRGSITTAMFAHQRLLLSQCGTHRLLQAAAAAAVVAAACSCCSCCCCRRRLCAECVFRGGSSCSSRATGTSTTTTTAATGSTNSTSTGTAVLRVVLLVL
jgi:hypothetical protein